MQVKYIIWTDLWIQHLLVYNTFWMSRYFQIPFVALKLRLPRDTFWWRHRQLASKSHNAHLLVCLLEKYQNFHTFLSELLHIVEERNLRLACYSFPNLPKYFRMIRKVAESLNLSARTKELTAHSRLLCVATVAVHLHQTMGFQTSLYSMDSALTLFFAFWEIVFMCPLKYSDT